MEIIKEKLREFGLTSISVANATSVFILTLMIMIFGFKSYDELPKEQFPEVLFPTLYINTPYFGNSAKDIESLVTRPIEKELQGIEGVKNIKSTSIQDYSVVTIEFETYVDFSEATRKVKDAVDIAKSELPNDLTSDPLVLEVNLSELPIMTVNISGNYRNEVLKEYAEIVKDELENINEISEVDMKGDLEKEVKIDVDLPKMEARKVSFSDIAQAVGQENLTLSGGEIQHNDFRRAIRVKGEFEDPNQIKNIIVKSEFQNPVYLRDIAEVTFGFKDRSSIARSDGFPVISLDVIKRKGRNLLSAADQVKKIINKSKRQIPSDIKISIFNDQSVNTQNDVDNLENSIISGVILVVLVLLFFLGLRNALFVGLAIPLSMLLGILFLSLTGVTLNIVVLFSLILALGLLVDNGIVVVENIYRYMQEGYSSFDAAKFGAGEVAIPIIASTATTLAAFLPLAFWPGLVGEFMKYMPITLILVLGSSLIVALIINPVFTKQFMKVEDEGFDLSKFKSGIKRIMFIFGGLLSVSIIGFISETIWMRNLFLIAASLVLINYFALSPLASLFQTKVLPRLELYYENFVGKALRWPKSVFFGTFLLLVGTFALVSNFPPPVQFFPKVDPVYVNAFVEMPLGTDIEATDVTMKKIEKSLQVVIDKYDGIVEAVLSQIGENTSDPNGPPEPGASPNKARLTVQFVKYQDRERISTAKVMEEIRDAVKGFPGVQIIVDKNADGPAVGKPINIELRGEDLDKLLTESANLINFINKSSIRGIERLQADVKLGKPELEVVLDRETARRYGVSTAVVGEAIRTAVFGKEISKYKDGEDEYEINLRLAPEYRQSVESVLSQKITFRDLATGQIAQVPISTVASAKYTSTYSSIKRKDLKRVVTVYSNVLDGYYAEEINNQLSALILDYPLPAGLSYEFTGEQQQQAEDAAFLSSAFLVAVFVIFIILVSQFNSILAPFIIVLSILFSIIGVLLGYFLNNREYSVIFSSVGIISLAGVVVNNAIVLIDYINLLIKRAREKLNLENMSDLEDEEIKNQIIKAGATRLRPVLLTAITTILGLIPLVVGFNFNFFTLITKSDPQIFIGGDSTAFWGPMAWTVIYGLMFATFLTLVVVPVMYWLAYKFKTFFVNLFV